MKLVSTLVIIAGFSSLAFASPSKYNPKRIYSALNVPEVTVNGGIVGNVTKKKAVGGLSCEKSKAVAPHSVYEYVCSVEQNPDDVDAQAIYGALKVKEVKMKNVPEGQSMLQKSVGGLVCEKSSVVGPHAVAEYSCVILQ